MAYSPIYDRRRILDLCRAGKSDEEVRLMVGCSKSLVQQYRRSAEVRPASRNRPWTAREDRLLVRLMEEGDRRTDIAAWLGRSVQSVMNRVHRLGASGRYDYYRSRIRAHSLIWVMAERGYSTERIARRMRLSVSRVRAVIGFAPSCFEIQRKTRKRRSET